MKAKLIITSLILISISSYAQEKIKRFEFSSVSLQLGSVHHASSYTDVLDDFKRLMPNSTLLKTDFSDFKRNVGYYNEINVPAISALANFSVNKRNDKEKKIYQELRFGFSYSHTSLLSYGLFKTNKYTIDTLISQQNGDKHIVDSVETEYYSLNYYQNQVYLSAGYTISSNPSKRWKFYGGVTTSFGISFNTTSIVDYSKILRYETSPTFSYKPIDSNNHVFIEERERNKGGFTGLLSIPLGVDFRIGDGDNKWQRIHILLEFNPSLAYYSIPSIGSMVRTTTFSTLGVKLDL